MSRRPSEGLSPPPLSPAEASAQRLAPFVRPWEPVNHDPRDWPQHIPSLSRREDPWRGHRFMRALIAMQTDRNAAVAARDRAKAESGGDERG